MAFEVVRSEIAIASLVLLHLETHSLRDVPCMIAPQVSSPPERPTTNSFCLNARDGNRTHTPLAGLRILSPVRLPVSPPWRAHKFYNLPKLTTFALRACGGFCGALVSTNFGSLATACLLYSTERCEYRMVIAAVLWPINSIIALGAVPFIASHEPKQCRRS